MQSSIATDWYLYLSKLDPYSLLTRQQVARFLHISMKTLSRRCKLGLIAFIKVERNVRFTVQAVLDYIDRYSVAPS